jgi:hypothetical protein
MSHVSHVAFYQYFCPNVGHFYTKNFGELGYGSQGYSLERIECLVQEGPAEGAVALWRFRHGTKSTHFYTINRSEFTEHEKVFRNYVDEGIECYVWPVRYGDLIALWRYFRPGDDDHFYTTWREKRHDPEWEAIRTGQKQPVIQGYISEGVACWVIDPGD